MVVTKFFKNFYIYILIFALGLGFRIFALSTEPPLHIDEVFSFVGSTSSSNLDKDSLYEFKIRWNILRFENNKEYYSKDIQKALFVGEKSVSSVIKDFKKLRDSNIDRQHPTLYYSILRVWNLSLKDFNPNKYVNHARTLNLVFYLISFFFMFKLLQFIKNDKKFISLGLFFAFTNAGGIMIDTMAREYALMEAFLIISTYIACIIGKKIVDNENIPIPMLFVYPLGFSLFLLSGYFALIYMVILITVLLSICIYYKRWYKIFNLFVILITTYLYTVLFYPLYFDFSLQNEHYETMKSNIKNIFSINSIIDLIPVLCKHFIDYVFDKIIYFIVLFNICLYFIIPNPKCCDDNYFSKKETFCILILIAVSFCWAFLVNQTTPYSYYARYIMPAAAIYCLMTVLLVYRFKPIILYSILVLTCFINFINIKNSNIIDIDRIKHLNGNGNIVSTYTKVPDFGPIVIAETEYYYPIEQFMFASIPHNKNKVIIFTSKIPESDFKYEKFILVCRSHLMPNKKPFMTIRGKLGIYLMNKKSKKNGENQSKRAS